MRELKWEDGPIMEVAQGVAKYLGLGARGLDELGFEVLRAIRQLDWWRVLDVAELGAWHCSIWNQWDEEAENARVLGTGWGRIQRKR